MNKFLGLFGMSAAALTLALFAFGAEAQKAPEKAKAPPKCTTVKQQVDCEGRADCTWRQASVDAKTKKQTRAASCAAKPKAPAPAKK